MKDSARISKLIAHLRERGHFFRTCEKDVGDQLLRKFPIASHGRVAWHKLSQKHTHAWDDNDELRREFSVLLEKERLSHHNAVYVLWTDSNKPEVFTTLKVVMDNLIEFVEQDWDTWMISEDGRWIIECYHEGEICFGLRDDNLPSRLSK